MYTLEIVKGPIPTKSVISVADLEARLTEGGGSRDVSKIGIKGFPNFKFCHNFEELCRRVCGWVWQG